jgi:hypothetical protein
MYVLGHDDPSTSFYYANVVVTEGIKITSTPDMISQMNRQDAEFKHAAEDRNKMDARMEAFETALISGRAPAPAAAAPPDAAPAPAAPAAAPAVAPAPAAPVASQVFVALPKIGGGVFYAKPFDKTSFFRRFKPSQLELKKVFLAASAAEVKSALLGVDLPKVRDEQWVAINVPRNIGRELVN